MQKFKGGGVRGQLAGCSFQIDGVGLHPPAQGTALGTGDRQTEGPPPLDAWRADSIIPVL